MRSASRRSLCLVLAITLPSCAGRLFCADEKAPAAEKPPAAALLEAALQLENARRYDEALVKLRAAAALDAPPTLAADILYRTGETLFRKGRDMAQQRTLSTEAAPTLRQAEKTLKEVLDRYPKAEKASSAGYLRGTCLLLLDEMQNALAAYKHVFDAYPGSREQPGALVRMGVCQAGLGNVAGAKTAFELFLTQFPQEKADAPKLRQQLLELTLVGRPAPPLAPKSWLQGAIGERGLAELQGQPVVVVFFATWCPNCANELPHLRVLMREWNPKGVAFIGVANPEDPRATMSVDEYVRTRTLDFADVALDPTTRAMAAYRVTGFPAAAIIDRTGTVRWRGHLSFLPNGLIAESAKPEAKP